MPMISERKTSKRQDHAKSPIPIPKLPQSYPSSSLEASFPVASHALPSTAASAGYGRHPSCASGVSAQINARNLAAQVVPIVVVGSWLVIVATHFAMGHARRALIETACVFLGVRVWGRGH